MAHFHRLCVYCGSSPGQDPGYIQAARELGTAMAKANIGLVYGGSGVGLMGEIARSVIDNGGHVTGIIPEFLVSKERMLNRDCELIVTKTMHERKMLMFENATGFVALPGGVGTLEELSEILTWAQLKQHAKPVILCNINGFWNSLVELLKNMRNQGFIRPPYDVILEVADNPKATISTYLDREARTGDFKPSSAIEKSL